MILSVLFNFYYWKSSKYKIVYPSPPPPSWEKLKVRLWCICSRRVRKVSYRSCSSDAVSGNIMPMNSTGRCKFYTWEWKSRRAAEKDTENSNMVERISSGFGNYLRVEWSSNDRNTRVQRSKRIGKYRGNERPSFVLITICCNVFLCFFLRIRFVRRLISNDTRNITVAQTTHISRERFVVTARGD